MKLGIDVGRVLITPGDDAAPDTSFLRGNLESAMRTPPYGDMFEVVPRLVQHFQARVWIISKCGPAVQERTRRWLAHHRFFERTGIDPLHLRFCLKRPQKAEHCKELGITHFIDDRTDVLEAMRGIVPNRYLFGLQTRPASAGLTPAVSWRRVAELLL